MMQKEEKLPTSALGLYVKLYCKRKNKRETKYSSNLIEATRSWLALSQNEKEIFSEKYELYRKKFKQKFANYLKNAEPYLKKKEPPARPRSPDIQPDEEPQPGDDRAENTTFEHMQLDAVDGISGNINRAHLDDNVCQFEMQQEAITVENEQTESNLQEDMEPAVMLIEPTPPSIKNGQELFKLLNMKEENDLTWRSLSPAQKRRYQAAVLLLKKDYITKYKVYLESLPLNKLFDHYNIKCS